MTQPLFSRDWRAAAPRLSAHGLGGTGLKLNTPVLPGENNVLLVLLPEADVPTVTDALYRLQATYRLKPGLTLIVHDVTLPVKPRDV